MKTNEFLTLLKKHPDKSLLFEYRAGHFVGANYHITEIKNVTIDSVDCGTGTDFWKETIVQLWKSPDEHEKDEYMSSQKALDILNKVDKIKPMLKEAEVKFEYDNTAFHTPQLFVKDIEIRNDQFIVNLSVEKTDCKANETCGVTEIASTKEEACCAPGGGCC